MFKYLIAILFVVIGFVGCTSSKQTFDGTKADTTSAQNQIVENPASTPINESCPTELGDVVDPALIEKIGPPGRKTESGFKTHSAVFFAGPNVELKAPFDVELFEGSKYLEQGKVQYLLHFNGPCQLKLNLDHVSDPGKEIADLFPGEPAVEDSRTNMVGPFYLKKGDNIGKTSGNALVKSFDLGLYDLSKTNYLRNDPEYKNRDEFSAWKFWNAVCPFDYYDSSKKEVYYSKIKSIDGTSIPTTFCKSN